MGGKSSKAKAKANATTAGIVKIPFLWSTCEFDLSFPEALQGKVLPDEYEGFLQTINYDVLEPFSAKWRDPLYEAVSASAAGKMEAADVRKVIGHHVTAVPTSIVVEAAEDPTSAAERLNDWNANAVPIIKEYLGKVMASADTIGDPITITLSTAMFDGATLNALLTKRFETEGVDIVEPVAMSTVLKAKFDAMDSDGSLVVDKAGFFAAVEADEDLAKILIDGGFGTGEDAMSKIETSEDGRMQWSELEGAVLKVPASGAEKVGFRFDETGSFEVPCLEVSKATVVAFDADTDADDYLKHTALIIVDVQNDFISGSLKVGNDPEAVVSAINDLRAQVAFGYVVHTQDSHPADHISFVDNHEGAEPFSHVQVPAPDDSGTTIDQVMWPRHCVQESEGWKFHPDLAVPETDYIQAKGTTSKVDSYSGFFDNLHGSHTGLEAVLREQHITDVFVVGLAYDYCAGLTACDAAHLGFRTRLVKDCTRAVSSETEACMDESLMAAGVEIIRAADVFEAATHGYRTSKAAAEKDGRESLFTEIHREKSAARHSSLYQDADLKLVASKHAGGPEAGFEMADPPEAGDAEAGDAEAGGEDSSPKKPSRRLSYQELKESREQTRAQKEAEAAAEAAAAADFAAKAQAETEAAAAEAAKSNVLSAAAQQHQDKFKERRASFSAAQAKPRRGSQGK